MKDKNNLLQDVDIDEEFLEEDDNENDIVKVNTPAAFICCILISVFIGSLLFSYSFFEANTTIIEMTNNDYNTLMYELSQNDKNSYTQSKYSSPSRSYYDFLKDAHHMANSVIVYEIKNGILQITERRVNYLLWELERFEIKNKDRLRQYLIKWKHKDFSYSPAFHDYVWVELGGNPSAYRHVLSSARKYFYYIKTVPFKSLVLFTFIIIGVWIACYIVRKEVKSKNLEEMNDYLNLLLHYIKDFVRENKLILLLILTLSILIKLNCNVSFRTSFDKISYSYEIHEIFVGIITGIWILLLGCISYDIFLKKVFSFVKTEARNLIKFE